MKLFRVSLVIALAALAAPSFSQGLEKVIVKPKDIVFCSPAPLGGHTCQLKDETVVWTAPNGTSFLLYKKEKKTV